MFKRQSFCLFVVILGHFLKKRYRRRVEKHIKRGVGIITHNSYYLEIKK